MKTMNPANQSLTLKSLMFFVATVLLALPGRVSADAKHDWNLGAQGMCG